MQLVTRHHTVAAFAGGMKAQAPGPEVHMYSHHAIRNYALAALGALTLSATPADQDPQAAAHDGANSAAPARDWMHEAFLTLRVQSSLAGRLDAGAARIRVAVRGSDVTLAGQVEKKSDIAEAERVARSVEGVARVTNRISLAGDR